MNDVIVFQTEYASGGAYLPDASRLPGISLIETTLSADRVFHGTSAHATKVASIITGGVAAGLIKTLYTGEAATYLGRASSTNLFGLNTGRHLPPTAATWDIINCSWGSSDQNFENDQPAQPATSTTEAIPLLPGALSRHIAQLTQANAIGVNGPPDAGMKPFRLLNAARSNNILRVGSSITPMVLNNELGYDILIPVAYTSYAIPTATQTLVAMLGWLKHKGVKYLAADIVSIVKVQYHLDKFHDPQRCLGALGNFYAPPL